jgi:hypothetical protein
MIMTDKLRATQSPDHRITRLSGHPMSRSTCSRHATRNSQLIRLLVLALLFVSACAAQKQQKEQVREPAVAGAFYPADPKQLGEMVDGFLTKAPDIKGPLVALIAPHAGYPYSGGVAAYSYALLKSRKFARVVVIAPSHYEAFHFISVYDGDAYATPLGHIPVDREFARKLAGSGALLKLSSRAHLSGSGAGPSQEHALEVQLPFLQRTLGSFKLVPVIMGEQNYETSRALGVALAKLIGNSRDTLIVVSSDLSHYHPYDEAVQLDHKALNAITGWDYLSASQNFERDVWEACGGGPIVAAMIAAERLGATEARLLKYANSGDVTDEQARVVGYGAVALMRASSPKPAGTAAYSLTAPEREMLLKIARRSVESAVREHKLYDPPRQTLDTLAEERGAFVTLRQQGELRGCIGYTSPTTPLYLTVRDVAAFAAVRDPRFPPVSASEMEKLEYEISVLSPMRRVTDIQQIQVGRHGLLMKNRQNEGLLLPQVPGEFGWNRKQFLEATCEKSGMSPNCWQSDDTDIFMFTALVFDEHGPAPPNNPVRNEAKTPPERLDRQPPRP